MTEVLVVKIPYKLKDWLFGKALAEGTTASALVRALIMREKATSETPQRKP